MKPQYNIYLKEQKKEHVHIFYEKSKDERIRKYMYRLPNTLDEAFDEYRNKDYTYYRCVIYVDEYYIGDIWCHGLFKLNHVDALLSCCIFDTEYWNKGVATCALDMFLNEIKDKFHVHTVGAYLYEDNKGSLKVLVKNNFKRVDTFVEQNKIAYFYKKEL